MKQICFFFFYFITFPVLLPAQNNDTTLLNNDTVLKVNFITRTLKADTSIPSFLKGNSLLNISGKPFSLTGSYKTLQSKDSIFYLLAALVLVLALFRYFLPRYFSNLFRVFFNTSLRQSQLTDQLLQSKLPSLLFNIFFIICGGIYVYSMLNYYQLVNAINKWFLISLSMATLGLVYIIKFCSLKFTGWITGYKDTTNTYIFIIFLINKIIGIFLLPFIILITFSDKYLVNPAVIISLFIIGFLLLLRFFRSYGLLQNQLKVSWFHFFLFIIAVELLPLLLIYKGLMLLLSKNM